MANNTIQQFVAVAKQMFGDDVDSMNREAMIRVAKMVGISTPHFLAKDEHRISRGIYSLKSLERAEIQSHARKFQAPVTAEFAMHPVTMPVNSSSEIVRPTFSINERFDFAARLVRMVATGIANSAILVSEAGLGKTHMVRSTLTALDLEECLTVESDGETVTYPGDFIFFKGYSTAKAMYRALWENNGKIIVFDDIDSIWSDKNAVNVLKAALDSYETRIISWNSESRDPNDELPKRFEFTGRVIFISNKRLADLDEAVRSRSMTVDLSATAEEKLEWMQTILDKFMPEHPMCLKQEVLDFFKEHVKLARSISMRTLRNLVLIRVAHNADDWQLLAKYSLINI